MRELLQQLISDSLSTPIPPYTTRDAYHPQIPGKALAVIGMRRSVMLDAIPPQPALPAPLQWCSAVSWLLERDNA